MQKRMLALAAGILLFVVAVIIMLAVGIHRESKVEEYTDRETKTLPTVSFICEGMSADPLFGFGTEMIRSPTRAPCFPVPTVPWRYVIRI